MEQVLKRNENENSVLVSNIFLGLMVLVLLICLLEVCGVFEVDFNLTSVFAITLSILLVIPVIMIRIFRIRAPRLGYLYFFALYYLIGRNLRIII